MKKAVVYQLTSPIPGAKITGISVSVETSELTIVWDGEAIAETSLPVETQPLPHTDANPEHISGPLGRTLQSIPAPIDPPPARRYGGPTPQRAPSPPAVEYPENPPTILHPDDPNAPQDVDRELHETTAAPLPEHAPTEPLPAPRVDPGAPTDIDATLHAQRQAGAARYTEADDRAVSEAALVAELKRRADLVDPNAPSDIDAMLGRGNRGGPSGYPEAPPSTRPTPAPAPFALAPGDPNRPEDIDAMLGRRVVDIGPQAGLVDVDAALSGMGRRSQPAPEPAEIRTENIPTNSELTEHLVARRTAQVTDKLECTCEAPSPVDVGDSKAAKVPCQTCGRWTPNPAAAEASS